jgi:parallel beta-helix repeat protein
MKTAAHILIPFFSLLLFALLPFSSQATNYYSDPSAAGSMSNSGSFAAPWANLSSVFAANKTFAAGDTIFLRTGSHGYVIIKGIHTGYVVITPQPGQTPVIQRIRVSASAAIAAAYWKLYGLTVQSESTGTTATPSYTLLEIYPYADHITVSNCIISSNLNTSGWTRTDWRNRCNSGIFTRGKLNAHHIIENNLIQNTAFALTVSSSRTIVRENTVQNFTNDGCRILGSDILFEKNRVFDLIKVMTNAENHDDLFQAFTYAAGGTGQDTLKNDTIRNNILINMTDTTRQFRGPTQGIGCFDGVFLNWIIENNIVMTDHWHGISMYGAVNCKIINNTVLDPYLYTPVDSIDQNSTNIGPAWILINKKTNGPESSGNLVKNNLVANIVSFAAPGMGTGSNNKIVGALANYSNYFVNTADFGHPGQFDLHLKPGCSAIDAGDATYAPLIDFEGTPRPKGLGFDIGAYEYTVVSAVQSPSRNENALSVFPNPFSDEISIQTDVVLPGGSVLQIFSLNGQLMLEKTTVEGGDAIKLEHLSGLPGGMYFLKISAGNNCFKPIKLFKTK